MRKNFRVGPAILIFLGAIFLLNNFGVLPWDIWTSIWKFWPVILILIGIEFLLGQAFSWRTLIILLIIIFLVPTLWAVNPITKNPLATEELPVSEDLGTLTRAKIIIDLAATNLHLKAAATNSAKLVEGKISFSKAANKPDVVKEEDFGHMLLTITQKVESPLPFISSLKNTTDLAFTQQIPLEITIKTGAASGDIDLNLLRIDYLEINSQATNLKIKFGKSYSSRGIIKGQASNVEVEIPKEIATRVKIDSRVKNLSVDERFKGEGGTYTSGDFGKAFTRIDIEISATAGSITIR
jgi:hypothetical protein